MFRVFCLLLATLGFLLAVPALAVEDDDAGTVPLDSVERAETRSLDSVDTGHTESLDSVDRGHTDSLDSVDTGRTDSLDSVDTGRTDSLDAVDTGHTSSLDRAEADHGPWQPPACADVELSLGELPAGSDADAWADTLEEAHERLESSKRALARADAAYARSLNFATTLGSERAAIVEARDEAREAYARDRCALPALVAHARAAGVAPGLLRRFETTPADAGY